MRQSRARQKRMEQARLRRERYATPRHRAPSPVAGSPGGSTTDSWPEYDYILKYRQGGEWKLFNRRTMDYIDPEKGPEAILWSRGPRMITSEMSIINGRSDKTGSVSSGRTLRPDFRPPGGSLAANAIDVMFDGKRIPSEPVPRQNEGWAASERSMSRPGYRAIGR